MNRERIPTRWLVACGCMLALAGCADQQPDRDQDVPAADDEVAASHILVAWTGVRDCPRGLERTEDEALERARRLALLLRTGRGELDDLAQRYSDDPTASRNGGYLGVFRPGEMDAALDALVRSLADGEVGGPIATAYGWHVVRREPLPRLRLHHVLIAHRDARQADASLRRDRGEAQRIAGALRAKMIDPGVDPCQVAASFSDDPQNRQHCGDLGWIEPGLLEPMAERAVMALEPGEVSPVVESAFGFHIFWRP